MKMEQNKNNENVASKKPDIIEKEKAKKLKQQREIESFKRKYFDYYDDIKISVKEDW